MITIPFIGFTRATGRSLPKLGKRIIIIIIAILIVQYILKYSSLSYRKYPDLPFSLHLNTQDLVMVKGERYRLFVWGINKRVSYSTTNFRVAGVTFNGIVYAHQPGRTVIEAKVDDRVLKCRVRVIELNKDRLTLKAGETKRLRVKGIVAFPKWRSNNSKVAKVSRFGKVTAQGKGKTEIFGKVKGKEVKCIVTVR